MVAEATIPAGLVRDVMHASPSQMFRARQVSNLGGLLAGAGGNANHPANAVAALFAATGQDIANVAESSAALVHTELLADGSYYYSITIPALIVATYGGGTGLPTQRECLELLGCYGSGRVRKFAEIVAATVLCGEVSLGAAVVADEWVTAHERLGRNRPREEVMSDTLDRMSTLDAEFFFAEHGDVPLHIGSVAVFDGPAPTREDLMRLFEAKLPLVPRYRQVVRTAPFQLLRPVWTDDQEFSIRHHVRYTTVPAPGGSEQLRAVGHVIEVIGEQMPVLIERHGRRFMA